ncbi:MAG TPA: hypothetical protein VHI77_05995 [Solirubrobacterales bacterium]|jgi:hypothetical protein|nr:hypothetical protein [Solirubrobacterales bacterium]
MSAGTVGAEHASTRPAVGANPLTDGPTVLVVAVAEAEGSRGAAAALACAGADIDHAALLIDVGGRPPRPTLVASAAAQRLEERLAAHLPRLRVAARGQVCHLAVAAEEAGLQAASAAVTVARGALAAVHVSPDLFQSVLGGFGPRPTGVLLRADLASDRPLVALVTRHLLTRGLAVSVLKRRLPWFAERRALFGALPPNQAGNLPAQVRRQLIPASYLDLDEPRDGAGEAKPGEGEGRAGAGS